MIQPKIFDDEQYINADIEGEDDLSQKVNGLNEAVLWGTDWTTETISNQLNKGTIDLNPKFQRRDAWSDAAKSRFIESLILGLPIPQIILAEKSDKKGQYIVIDGKQRLLTIRKFFSNSSEFTPLKLKGLEVLTSLNGKTYQDLINDPEYISLINQLQNQPIRTTVIKNWPNEAFLYMVFLRLNTGSIKLSPQELRQALHPGSFIDFADDFSLASQQIKEILGISIPDYRMRDVELVIRYFTFKYFITQYDGNLKNSFDLTVKVLNNDWISNSQQITNDANELNNAISFIIVIFADDAFAKWHNGIFQKNFNRAIYDIMVYYFSDSNIRHASLGKEVLIKDKFKELCDNDRDFLLSFEHTTKSLQNTSKRFLTWGKILSDTIGINFDIPVLTINNRFELINSTNVTI